MAKELKKKPTGPILPTTADEKKKALQSAIAHLEKVYGKGTVMRLGSNTHMQVDAIPTGSISLDMALGIGGVPRGRIVELYGPESSGKTTVALHIIAEAQKKAERLPLLTWNTPWIRSMPRRLASTSMSC